MNIPSGLSGHWTDEQIIEHLYAGGPEDNHLLSCEDCLNRLSLMREHRRSIEEASVSEEPGIEMLAAQRRDIYARLAEEQNRRWPAWGMPRWVAAAAMLLAIGGSAFLLEDHSQSIFHSPNRQEAAASNVSDSQLAAEVSQMADSAEPGPTEPLQALFAE